MVLYDIARSLLTDPLFRAAAIALGWWLMHVLETWHTPASLDSSAMRLWWCWVDRLNGQLHLALPCAAACPLPRNT